MVKLVNRAKMKVASGGAGTLTLGTACDGYQTFAAAGVTDQNKLRYAITDGNDWEIGVGTYTASGTTIARAVTESSNSGNAITCGSGAEIFVTMAAEDFTGNVAPRFDSSPPATHQLAADGSTTTITGTAVDEQGFPIQYSWDGWSGSSVYKDDLLPSQLTSNPTISASGVVTLTPSTTAAGTFNFRLKASDGVKTAVATTEMTLSFGFNVAAASYDSKSLAVNNQESSARGIAISATGDKFFVVGNAGDKVFQYDLSTNFDISTATYNSGASIAIYSSNTFASGIYFNAAGTKMYITDFAYNLMREYTLSTGFDLSTVTNTGNTLDTGGQADAQNGVHFNAAGTKMIVSAGGTGGANSLDSVWSYTLSTGFDLSTASYDSVRFNLNGQLNDPEGIYFNPAGTKMFAVALNGNVYEYSLSSGHDISTASYSGTSFNASSQTGTSLHDICFGNNGQKMYLLKNSNPSTVYQYSTP